MAVGDFDDIYNRLIKNIPDWFGTDHPNLDALLQAFVSVFYFHYNDQYLYALLQQRIQTATDDNLDLISQDYLGLYLPRRPNENDDTYRQRILATVVQEKGTRNGMSNALRILTGYTPLIYEGWNADDCMCYGDGADPLENTVITGGYSYFDDDGIQQTFGDMAYGDMSSDFFPYQFEIVVYLDSNQGLGDFPGYDPIGIPYDPVYYFGYDEDWYYGDESMVTTIITDSMIRQVIELTKTLGTNLHKLTIAYVNG